MIENKIKKSRPISRAQSFREAMRRAPELLRHDIETMTREELAEKLTTYEPGVPHFWFGRPVAPITKEELLAFWSGGPDIEPRYLDELPAPAQGEKVNAP